MQYEFTRLERGRLNESIINRAFKDIGTDILQLYNDIEEIRGDSETLLEIVNLHGNMLSRLNQTIETRLTALEAGVSSNTLYNSDDIFFPDNVQTTEQAHVEYDFGVATCGVMNSRRLFTVIKDDEVTLAVDAHENIVRTISNNKFREKADKIIENDIMKAFDPQDTHPYLLTIETENPSFTIAELILNILNVNRMINTIKIKPQPLLELTIKKWNLVDSTGEIAITNPIGEELSIPINNAENIFITFPEKQISSIDMVVQQQNKSETLPYHFPIGFSDIEVAYNEYFNKGFIGFQFVTPTDDVGKYKDLKAVNFNWTFLENFTRAFVYDNEDDANTVSDNYIDVITTDGIVYSQAKTIDNDTLYIVVELNKLTTGTSPMLRSVSVQFV